MTIQAEPVQNGMEKNVKPMQSYPYGWPAAMATPTNSTVPQYAFDAYQQQMVQLYGRYDIPMINQFHNSYLTNGATSASMGFNPYMMGQQAYAPLAASPYAYMGGPSLATIKDEWDGRDGSSSSATTPSGSIASPQPCGENGADQRGALMGLKDVVDLYLPVAEQPPAQSHELHYFNSVNAVDASCRAPHPSHPMQHL